MGPPESPALDAAAYERLFDLFGAARGLPPPERRALLDRACGDQPALRAELEAMLAASDEGGALELERALVLRDADADAAPEFIGPYRVLRRLARGGMGEVHLAEHVDGHFRRLVAVKLLRPGLEFTDVLDRFRLERELLGRLTHPSVVPLLDGGSTSDGRPYLVLQYVDGLPITDYCVERRLPVRERLRLFVALCRAVQYAHSNLVVHRDLKPSNILVTPDGEIRLLDFGIAKLLSAEPVGGEPTRSALAPMTPARAAPEQHAGSPVTTATDVWALGVLLHELLCGRLPARREAAAAPQLDPDLDAPRDLVAIVSQALRLEPDRRYESAGQLGEDVERWLAGEPVRARPSSLGYRAVRFVARHRAAVALAAVAVLALATLAAVSTAQSWRIARERNRAAAEERKANAVVDLLVQLFSGADPAEGAVGESIRYDVLLERGERRAAELAGQPDVQARMRHALGRILLERSAFDRALELLREARDAEVARLGPEDPRHAQLRLDYARALHARGRLDDARAELAAATRSLEAAPEADPLLLARALRDYGAHLGGEEGRGMMERAIGILRSQPDVDPVTLGGHLVALATIARQQGENDRARGLFREALDLELPVLGAEHPSVLSLRSNLASFIDDPAERAREYRDLLELRIERLGPRAHGVGSSWNLLGLALLESGDALAAERAFREARAIWTESAGAGNLMSLNMSAHVALALAVQRRYEEALSVYDELLAAGDAGPAAGGSQHGGSRGDLAGWRGLRAGVLLRLGRTEEATLAAEAALVELESFRPRAGRGRARTLVVLAAAKRAAGRPAEALALLERAPSELDANVPPDDPDRVAIEAQRGRTLLELGRTSEAATALANALASPRGWRLAHPDDLAAARAALAQARGTVPGPAAGVSPAA